jgi:hypothetical protein
MAGHLTSRKPVIDQLPGAVVLSGAKNLLPDLALTRSEDPSLRSG